MCSPILDMFNGVGGKVVKTIISVTKVEVC